MMQLCYEDAYCDLGLWQLGSHRNFPEHFFSNEDEEIEWKLQQEVLKDNG